ncbi:MAG: LPS export ABC transporter periplasmic protein LptC [Deltaproteobacteria bacterium]|nr:MAG: LPS export ABC transporter periplasmic protein LptC [Deltaproteobacteria bacterium]
MENFPHKPPKGWRRFWGWKGLAGLILLAGLGWGLYEWSSPAPPPPPPPAPLETKARMESLALSEIQEGNKRWTLEAQSADFSKEKLEVKITGVKVEFFGGPDEVIRVKAQEGLINTKTRVLTLKGQVEMVSGNLRITTDRVIYQPGERLLSAPEEVTLEEPRLKVQGRDLQVKLAEKKLVLAQHRLTQVNVPNLELKP